MVVLFDVLVWGILMPLGFVFCLVFGFEFVCLFVLECFIFVVYFGCGFGFGF